MKFKNTSKQSHCLVNRSVTISKKEKGKVSAVLPRINNKIIFPAHIERDVPADDMAWLKDDASFKNLISLQVLVEVDQSKAASKNSASEEEEILKEIAEDLKSDTKKLNKDQAKLAKDQAKLAEDQAKLKDGAAK